MDERFKPWVIHTSKVVAVGAGSTAVAILTSEVAQSFFAGHPYAQIFVYALGIASGVIAKSPYFKGAK